MFLLNCSEQFNKNIAVLIKEKSVSGRNLKFISFSTFIKTSWYINVLQKKSLDKAFLFLGWLVVMCSYTNFEFNHNVFHLLNYRVPPPPPLVPNGI